MVYGGERCRRTRLSPGSRLLRRLPGMLGTMLLLLLLAGSLVTKTYYLKTGSMAPMYPAGSVIVTTKLLPPRVGTVCAYRRGDMTVIHRVIEETQEGYLFQGDANNVADPMEVKPEQIEGRMLFGFPAGMLPLFPGEEQLQQKNKKQEQNKNIGNQEGGN